MTRTWTCRAFGVVLAAAALGMVDPKYTPIHLVNESQSIVLGTLTGGNAGQWTLQTVEARKKVVEVVAE